MAKLVTIKAKVKDLSEILSKLDLQDKDVDFSILVSLTDNKHNYTYLSTSDKVLDWDFYNDQKTSNNKIEVESLPTERTSDDILTEEELSGAINEKKIFKLLNTPEFKSSPYGMLNLIKLSWHLSKKQPIPYLNSNYISMNLRGGTLICDIIYPDDSQSVRTINNYYSLLPFPDSLEHLLGLIYKHWRDFKNCDTLEEVLTLLFA